MSQVKRDLFQKIEQTIKRKKAAAQRAAQNKDVFQWIYEFFRELEKFKAEPSNQFTSLALTQLTNQLHSVDKDCCVILKEPVDGEAVIEIRWSAKYAQQHNLEAITLFDAASVFFEDAMKI